MKRNILRKKESGRSVYLLYTLCFFALSAMIVALYSAAGKSFVWWDDGMYQHVNSLAYYGKYLREVFSGFFRGDFELPMFDLSIGYGSDIMTTLNYYVFGDPFAFFSVFVPSASRKSFTMFSSSSACICAASFSASLSVTEADAAFPPCFAGA